jgi:sulfite exporter TauE/SafE/plastocyanin domain-containing protein
MGLIASVSSCLAVTGGLLLASVARYHERHPEMTGMQKFKPTVYFNIGRIAGYTVLGALVGAVGSALTFSPKITGIITIVASLAMVVLGLKLLNLFPSVQRFMPRVPKFFGHRIHDLSERHSRFAPFLSGAATFFLPCGFTQSLQLFVLAQGKPLEGGIIMFLFSLGTLPALLSLSALSSFVKGSVKNYFFKFAGAVVVMLGIFNIGNGFTLAGATWKLPSLGRDNAVRAAQDSNVTTADGVQIAAMNVEGLEYVPSRFIVQKGVPVEWRVDGSRAQGCAQVITAPKLGITEYLPPQGVKTIRFTPTEEGEFPFSCTMGMTTRGAKFVVVEGGSDRGTVNTDEGTWKNEQESACDPTIANCIEIETQKLKMEISRERGFYPNTFVVKNGVPVELAIDTKIPMGGCMSTMVIPGYDVAHRLVLGTSTVRFTPKRVGTVPFTCSMGNRLGEFVVIN